MGISTPPLPLRPVIGEFADPLSALSLDAATPDPFAKPVRSVSIRSDAMRVLVAELHRYCNQEVGGRSFLISGHRGAGKTTMVQHAFRQVFAEAEQGAVRLRPLYVQLHGPSLFPDFADGVTIATRGSSATVEPPRPTAPVAPPAATAVPGVVVAPAAVAPPTAGAAASSKDAAQPALAEESTSTRDARLALEQITLALHRAVSREFVDAVWRAAVPRTRVGPVQGVARFMPVHETHHGARAELAAAFEHELHECPSPMRLRDFWVRLGVLQRGVLRRPAREQESAAVASSQGMRELVALSGVCEAYRRVSGRLDKSDSDVEDAAQRIEQAMSMDTTGKAVIPAIASMITGGLVGGGLALGHQSALEATIGGFVAAMGSSLVFKWSVSRSRGRAVKREYRFLFDTSMATLDRVLPVLLERLLAAGLAPVFVVDELDKVDHLSDRIFGMVRHLKKLVAESAFFCFLTDRSYFEEMRGRGARGAYPLEYSYFTHRLFVSYAPDNLHEYLGELLGEPGRLPPGVTPDPALSGAPAATVPPAYPLLRYMLLHRSEMHALELHRLLKSFRGEGGLVTLNTDDLPNTAAYRMDIGLQLGMEIVLDDKDLRDRIRDEPDFQRLAHDALLYPSRAWREGTMRIDFAAANQMHFGEYLVTRMNRSEATRAVERQAQSRARAHAGDRRGSAGDTVSRDDVTILWKKVQRLVDLLSDEGGLDVSFNDWNERRVREGRARVDRAVLDPILAANNSLFIKTPGKLEYQWRYDRYYVDQARMAAPAAGPGAPVPVDNTTPAIALITTFAQRLGRVVA
jgi:hypothetical protein